MSMLRIDHIIRIGTQECHQCLHGAQRLRTWLPRELNAHSLTLSLTHSLSHDELANTASIGVVRFHLPDHGVGVQ